jgi:hypothetical protein
MLKRIVLITMLAINALVLSSGSASALPDVSLTLTGSSFSLHLDVTLLLVSTHLSTSSGVGLEGVGALLLLLYDSLTSLGTFELLFTKFKERGALNAKLLEIRSVNCY